MAVSTHTLAHRQAWLQVRIAVYASRGFWVEAQNVNSSEHETLRLTIASRDVAPRQIEQVKRRQTHINKFFVMKAVCGARVRVCETTQTDS